MNRNSIVNRMEKKESKMKKKSCIISFHFITIIKWMFIKDINFLS